MEKIMNFIAALGQYVTENKEVVMAAIFAIILNTLKDTVIKDTWTFVKKKACAFCRFVKRQVQDYKRTVKASFREVGRVFNNVEFIEDFLFGYMWLMMLLVPYIWAVISVVEVIGCLVHKTPWTYDTTVNFIGIEAAFVILTVFFCHEAKKRRRKEGLPTTW